MRIVLLVLLFTQSACGVFRTGIRVDMATSDKTRVVMAIDYLNIQANKDVVAFNNQGNHYIVIYKVPDESFEEHILGVAYVGGMRCKIAIPERTFELGDEMLTTVIWHEIGHCYKLPHVANPEDIMYRSVKMITTYSEEIKQLFLRRLYEAAN